MMKLQALTVFVVIAHAHALKGEHAGPFGKHANIARQQSAALGYDPNSIPPLTAITSGMATGTTYAPTATFSPGSKPTAFSNAPQIPTFTVNPTDWPAMDKPPPTDTPQVQAWMLELEGHNIPDIPPTVDGTCGGDPTAAAAAEQNGWWTCGGWTRDTDIIDCPDKMTWGVSFDDGPAPYTQKLLNYMNSKDITATFFVVGSRALQYPDLLIEEYMAGHEISVHTWAHPPLTSRSTAQIVAELGWTRLIIQKILGITPTTMRSPYGDLDDRVRAIALAMGMIPIQWTRAPSGLTFDTNDWRVAGGTVIGTDQMAIFDSILSNATVMDNGFIVLQHDLFEITVDLAIGYTLPAATNHQPPFQLQRIGQCNNIPMSNMYVETNTNTTFPGAGATNATSPLPTAGHGPGLSNTTVSITNTSSANGSSGATATNENVPTGDATTFSLPVLGAVVAAGFAAFATMF
ncbi:hypothetical protein EUX98_g4413 [Antrodiella citrinella]|uniref:chitin deacetylase n=1 Tax=Antrodiella citrinella TaxID=2447956 RepID=A0A4S4MW04_9APHY|nr:hypothetical protein EUX98_g4413 [Antrodiella citrinella]